MLNNQLHFWINFLTLGCYNEFKFLFMKKNNNTIKHLTANIRFVEICVLRIGKAYLNN